MIPAKSSAASEIPASVNERIRNRLRTIREACGLQKTQITAVSSSTLTGVENKDCSRFRLGDLGALAEEYGWSLEEMLRYLSGDVEVTLPDNRNTKRMFFYLRSLTPDLQEIACEQVALLVKYNADMGEGVSARVIHQQGSLRRNARDILQAQLDAKASVNSHDNGGIG